MSLTDEQLQRLYTWVDEIPLSRPKRNIARDFADGVLLAEIVRHYFPRLVELHNYPPANSTQQKMYNWNTLNSKVLRKMGYNLYKDDIEAVIQCRPGAIEKVLHTLQMKMAKYRARRANSAGRAGTPSSRGASPARSSSVRGASPARSVLSEASAKPRLVQGAGMGGVKVPHDVASQQAMPPPPPGSSGTRNGAGVAGVGIDRDALRKEVDVELLAEKDRNIQDLKETVEILELKIAKLEQLVRLKDSKISKLQAAISRQQPTDENGEAIP